jgi:mannose-1-phosphate guanylyltransferase/phosphomannomutase
MTDVVVTVQFLASLVRNYFGDGEDLAMTLQYATEEEPLGTAGSVKNAEEALNDDTFLVISGDALCDVDLTKLVEFHREKKSSVTIGLKSVENPLEFGIVVTDEDGKKSLMVIGSDGNAHKRDVQTGIQTTDSVQIVSGVKPGEQVVSVGAYGLPDNTKVKVEAAPQPGKEKEGDQGQDKDKDDKD